jgi:hypothetical protein
VGGKSIYSEQLDPMKPDDTERLKEAAHGSVLVIAGDNLVVTESALNLAAAAALGTLVIGKVPVRS